MGRAVVVPREGSWLRPRADAQEGLGGQPGKGAPCLHGPVGQTARVGGLQLLFKQAGPHPGVHLKHVFIYPSRISSVGADGGNLQLPEGLVGAAVGSAWLGLGLLSLRPVVLRRGQRKQVVSGQVGQSLPFLQRRFCSMEKHILKL